MGGWVGGGKGGLEGLTHEPKFKQDVKTRSKHSGADVINKYVLIPEVKILGRKNTSKHSGEDVIYGMGGLIRT